MQVARDKLVSLGTCIGKFTHGGKFHLTIGALDILAQHAKYKVGVISVSPASRAARRHARACEPRSAAATPPACFGAPPAARGPSPHDTGSLPSSSSSWQVWVKPSAEMQYLYGNHVLKAGLGRITENTPGYTGVVILSMSDVPLGFGVTAKSTGECRTADPNAIVVFHQADVGEYLRAESEL